MSESQRVSLLELLQSYVPADPAESEHRRRMLHLLGRGSDPFARTSYDPGHFTASAIIVAPQDEAILLVFHAKLKKWLQPGGHIDPSDANVFAAARREVREETGIDLDPRGASIFDLDVHCIPARPNEPAHEHFDVRTFWLSSREEPEAGSDALEVKWHALADVVRRTGLDESLGRALRKLRKGAFPPPLNP